MALNKEVRIQELNSSGSKAIKSIDPYGRHNYFAEQMKEVNGSMDGEISGKLRRDKYDESQLLLAVDTVVDELIGEKPKDLPEVVLRSDYEDILAQLNACLAREADLKRQLAAAQSKISELQAEIDGLKSRLDTSELRIAVAENSAEAAADKFAQTSLDLQQAIQKSVAEAIERVSLEAQVEGLTAQKEALAQAYAKLEEQFQGKSAEVQQGASSSSGGDSAGAFTARVTPRTDESQPDFYLKTAHRNRNINLFNGPDIVVLNTSTEPLTISLKSSVNWMKVSPSVTIQSGESKTIQATFDKDKIGGLKPKRRRIGWNGKAQNHDGTITVSGGGETVVFKARMYKERNGK